MAALPKLINKDNIESFLGGIDNVLVDCDGVLWCMDEVLGQANTVINRLRELGKRIFYVTNNSTKNREVLAEKCEKLGFIVKDGETISPPFVIAEYLKSINFTKKIYVIGSQGITSELELAGLSYTGLGPDPVPENIYDLSNKFVADPDVGAVVVGFDSHFNLVKVMKAASYLTNPNCIFIASNKDERFPLKSQNMIFPGTGVIVKSVETAIGKEAESFGKPSPRMFEVLKNKFDLNPSRTLMVGDRCDTDILLGKNCSLQTMVVLTGITTWNEIQSWAQSSSPEKHRLLADYYLPALGDLAQLLPQ